MRTSHRRQEGFLNFGTRAVEDVVSATLLSDALYERLPNRRSCVICGRPLVKGNYYPCCARGCKEKYKDWLGERRR
ncbi:MAG: hypothetical protein ACK4WF_05380 [Candidatus Brocadiales bacterium]